MIRILTWADVDPARHPFDPGALHAVVRAVAPAELPPPRGQEGADRLVAALDLVRACADAGGALTFARLQAWQRVVLGVAEAPFRTTAFFHPFVERTRRHAEAIGLTGMREN